ncbi:MAG: hypothetical protein WC381_06605 [Kiritimatiellia bacterium]
MNTKHAWSVTLANCVVAAIWSAAIVRDRTEPRCTARVVEGAAQ